MRDQFISICIVSSDFRLDSDQKSMDLDCADSTGALQKLNVKRLAASLVRELRRVTLQCIG